MRQQPLYKLQWELHDESAAEETSLLSTKLKLSSQEFLMF